MWFVWQCDDVRLEIDVQSDDVVWNENTKRSGATGACMADGTSKPLQPVRYLTNMEGVSVCISLTYFKISINVTFGSLKYNISNV